MNSIFPASSSGGETLGLVDAETILDVGVEKLRSLGMTFRKAEYTTDFAGKVHTGTFDLDKEHAYDFYHRICLSSWNDHACQ